MMEARNAKGPTRRPAVPVGGFGGLSSPHPVSEIGKSPKPVPRWREKARVRPRWIFLWLVAPEALFALTTNQPPEKIPPLRPPAASG